jgi:hypothetical protein
MASKIALRLPIVLFVLCVFVQLVLDCSGKKWSQESERFCIVLQGYTPVYPENA